jgi:hypothetical protein
MFGLLAGHQGLPCSGPRSFLPLQTLCGTNPPLSHHHPRCTNMVSGKMMRVPDRVRGDLYLGIAVTSLYTLTAMGLIIAFT